MAEPIVDLFALFGPIPPRGAEPGTGALRAAHERHGVAGALALSTRGIYHSAAAGNRETLALCGESGGRLLPAAVLDPRVPGADTLVGGARALALFPALQNWPLRYAPLENALAALAARGTAVPLLFGSARPGDMTILRDLLAATRYGGPVVFLGVCGDTLSEAFAVAGDDPRYLLATDSLLGIGELDLAVRTLGVGRVVFGSGCVARGSLGAALAVVGASALSDADRNQVLGGNARRLLGAGGTA